MTTTKAAIVLVHGAWHDHHTWDLVVPLLNDAGHATVTIDLPGAGANAQYPASYYQRPLDPQAFGTEPSPNAGVTQDERTAATIAAVRRAATLGNGDVVLVGHSLAGLTLADVGEAFPDEIKSLVFLTAFLLAPGVVPLDMIQSSPMDGALVPGLFAADPEQTGALRFDANPTEAQGRAAIKATFYNDCTDAQFERALVTLHPDEPAQVAVVPSPVSIERFGNIDRHYIRCTDDHATPIAGQDHMIAHTDAALGSTTTTHTLATSHSPFYSAPQDLTDILIRVATS